MSTRSVGSVLGMIALLILIGVSNPCRNASSSFSSSDE